jgi:Zn finger protein HypA/HybF involved in hydrogenase expression
MKVIIRKVECKRCKHAWSPRKQDVRQCPKCKSAYWEKERENEQRHNSDNQKKVL